LEKSLRFQGTVLVRPRQADLFPTLPRKIPVPNRNRLKVFRSNSKAPNKLRKRRIDSGKNLSHFPALGTEVAKLATKSENQNPKEKKLSAFGSALF